jgi:hypothetical protein
MDFDKLPNDWKAGGVSYTKDELKATFAKMGAAVTREDYLKAQRHNWTRFFVPPAIFVLFWIALFIVFGKQPAAAPAEPVATGAGT